MKLRRSAVLLATLCLALGASSFAADNAYLHIVQGIPGYDVSKNLNPGYPVDILIDGDCLVRGLSFGSASGPLSFASGTYDVQISEANSLAPCTNTAVISAQVSWKLQTVRQSQPRSTEAASPLCCSSLTTSLRSRRVMRASSSRTRLMLRLWKPR